MATRRKKEMKLISAGLPRARHFDNSGHLDVVQAERLRALGMKPRGFDAVAFVDGSASEDDLAEELAEETVVAMTTGAHRIAEDMNDDVEEDWGGPFVVTSASKEFAHGTDESNIEEATREPFPTT